MQGKGTVAGVHNMQGFNLSPTEYTNRVQSISGKTPGLWSGDFLYPYEARTNDMKTHREEVVSEAKRQWDKGALVNIMWHAANPKSLMNGQTCLTCNEQGLVDGSVVDKCDPETGLGTGTGPWSSLTDTEWMQLVCV